MDEGLFENTNDSISFSTGNVQAGIFKQTA
jgi:hypothetical protein